MKMGPEDLGSGGGFDTRFVRKNGSSSVNEINSVKQSSLHMHFPREGRNISLWEFLDIFRDCIVYFVVFLKIFKRDCSFRCLAPTEVSTFNFFKSRFQGQVKHVFVALQFCLVFPVLLKGGTKILNKQLKSLF